jgi:putative spermidine/putrescine transport system substrate-binding protein
MAVASESDKKEAAMAYVNEALAPEFQKTASGQIGVGVTNTEAELNPKAKEYGVPTVDNYDQFTHPDFEFIRENRSEWTDRWQELFG